MKLDQITFTRFLAAISIVIYHYGKELFFYTNDDISFLFKKANIGVSYFYILSGFIMVIVYGNKPKIKILEYYKNRIARVYPMYIVALILLLLLKKIFPLKTIFFNVLVIQAWIPGIATSLNYPGWSIAVEVLFYLIFPFLLIYFYKKKSFIVISTAIISIWILSQIFMNWFIQSDWYDGYPSKSHDFAYYFPLMHLNEFLLGNLSGLLFLRKFKPKNYDLHIILITIIFFLLLKFSTLEFHNGLMGIIFAPLIIVISANTGLITKIFSKKIFVYLGEVSFAIYILQYPINIFTTKFLNFISYKPSDLVFFGIYITILTISSIMSFELIEKPSRNYIKNF